MRAVPLRPYRYRHQVKRVVYLPPDLDEWLLRRVGPQSTVSAFLRELVEAEREADRLLRAKTRVL